MKTGIVKFFNLEKGFGYITSNENGTEIFVRETDIEAPITHNDVVTFFLCNYKLGVKAIMLSLKLLESYNINNEYQL